jgi:hypothetical protein
MNNNETTEEDVCELCGGDEVMPDVEFHEGYGWVEAGERPCLCVVQRIDDELANE